MNKKYLLSFIVILAIFATSVRYACSCLDGSQFLPTLISFLSMPYSYIVFIIINICFILLLCLVVCNVIGVSKDNVRITGNGLKKKISIKRDDK
jgi:hypothetical protein